MKVKSLIDANGHAMPNQFVIEGEGTITFQSYDSTIAVYDCLAETLTVGPDWCYSVTTARALKQFLEVYNIFTYPGKAEFQKLIDKGEILYDDTL